MSVSAHIDNLLIKKQRLEEEIHSAYAHHLPMTGLKKQRLWIQDEIQRLMR